MAGSIYTCGKGFLVRKTCTDLFPILLPILKDPILHKIFSGLKLINGHLSW